MRSDSAPYAGTAMNSHAEAIMIPLSATSPVDVRVLRRVDQHERAVDVERAVLGAAHAGRLQHLLWIAAQDLDDRLARLARVSFIFVKDGVSRTAGG